MALVDSYITYGVSVKDLLKENGDTKDNQKPKNLNSPSKTLISIQHNVIVMLEVSVKTKIKNSRDRKTEKVN